MLILYGFLIFVNWIVKQLLFTNIVNLFYTIWNLLFGYQRHLVEKELQEEV